MLNAKWRATLIRVAVDFVCIQISMLLALVLVAAYYASQGTDSEWLKSSLLKYYLLNFLPVSPIFSAVLLQSGIYDVGRRYALKQKLALILRSSMIGSMATLAANYFLFRTNIVARSLTVAFSANVVVALSAVRVLASYVFRHFSIRARDESPENNGPVLVVGGAGYIGSMLCEMLLDAGERVRVLDSLVYGDFAIAHLKDHPDFELTVGDCRNIQNVVSAVKGAKAIVHLAAIVGDPACEQDRQNALEINYAATRMLVEIAKGNGVKRFVFASSCSVYGAAEVTMDEESETQPVSLYGHTKVDSERAILEERSENFHPTILRLATVFGLGKRPRFDLVVNLLTAKAAQEGVITIYNGEQWRPFIHVRDVARGFMTALNTPLELVSGRIFNLGDSRMNYTLTQVAEEIGRIFPGTRVQHVTNPDRRNYRVSFARAERILRFSSTLSLQDGIRELKGAFRAGRIPDYTDARYHNQRFLAAAGQLTSQNEVDTQVMAAFVWAKEHGHGVSTGHDFAQAAKV
ncbi:MAG TPA: SDR family oxidoreductase [Bryobacteraceae bacterium]|nr:SDR family oxidoreductase [Bryobacteraceae bacterium]